jgi:hypothetical protein
MRCSACGRFVPENEKMYSKSTLLPIRYLAIHSKIEPFVCVDCKPELEKEIKNHAKTLLWITISVIITGIIGSIIIFKYVII